MFAIGDIHGCDDLLASLLRAIDERTRGDAERPLLIFLGDYVDRGPDSRGVIERLIAVRAANPFTRFLCGNHEEVMLKFLSRPENGLNWPAYGGRATMLSYGVQPAERDDDLAGWRRVQAQLINRMPPEHLRFLRMLEDQLELGDYFFAHAGVRPGTALNAQKPADLRWIREPFLSDTAQLPKIVVHGHTPDPEPYADSRRIGVDTWAYKTGVLTAVELTGEARSFLQASRTDNGRVVCNQAA